MAGTGNIRIFCMFYLCVLFSYFYLYVLCYKTLARKWPCLSATNVEHDFCCIFGKAFMITAQYLNCILGIFFMVTAVKYCWKTIIFRNLMEKWTMEKLQWLKYLWKSLDIDNKFSHLSLHICTMNLCTISCFQFLCNQHIQQD